MSSALKVALGAAAIVVASFVGLSLVSGDALPGFGGAPSPLPNPSPSPSPSPSPLPSAALWPTGQLALGRHDATMSGVSFSFVVPTSDWTSVRYTGMIEKGFYPTANYRWIGFGVDANAAFADPCAHTSGPVVGPSAADLATALTTIPGTDAVGPSDVTVGGLPAKLVVLTIHDDIPCAPASFTLYGPGIYPNSRDSTIRVWIVDVHGTRFVIHSDQAGPDVEIGREIQQIVDSIIFE